MEFPGTAVRGAEVIQKAQVLSAGDGLPAGLIDGHCRQPAGVNVGGVWKNGMRESGLGLYNADTGSWKTALSNMEKGPDRLRSGGGYSIYRLIIWSDSLFFWRAFRLV